MSAPHQDQPLGWEAADVGAGTGGHVPLLTMRRSRWQDSAGQRCGQACCGTGGTSVRERSQQLLSPLNIPQGTQAPLFSRR